MPDGEKAYSIVRKKMNNRYFVGFICCLYQHQYVILGKMPLKLYERNECASVLVVSSICYHLHKVIKVQ